MTALYSLTAPATWYDIAALDTEYTSHTTDQPDEQDYQDAEIEELCDTYGFNILHPPVIAEHDIADWLAEHHWDGIVEGYRKCGPEISSDPERDAMHDIERHADLLAHYVHTIREERNS